MRVRLIGLGVALVTTLGAWGCGSYSSPNNTPAPPDSTKDSTMAPPGYDLGR
jgi:hypothetical protein